MLTLPTSLRVFAKTGATDMRKSFDGLTGLVERELGQQVESGDLFLFFNRRSNRVKVLWFAGDGLVIWYKKLTPHYPHLLFTEIGQYSDNLARRPVAAVGMDAGPPSFGPRRRPMPGETTVIVPPAPSLSRARRSRSIVEPADGRAATTNAGNAQRHRRATTRRALRRKGGAS